MQGWLDDMVQKSMHAMMSSEPHACLTLATESTTNLMFDFPDSREANI